MARVNREARRRLCYHFAMEVFNRRYLTLRGVRYHIREWGCAGAPQLFMLHGWCDVSATFQFLVDALKREWHVIAPDWRGFGRSGRRPGGSGASDAYWFPDYLADLDALLTHYSPQRPANLIGHSMGGNIACLYAGVRPERVAAVVALDGFGLADAPAPAAPARYRKWLDQLESPPGFRSHADLDAFVTHLQRENPRLDEKRARIWAQYLSEPDGQGGVRIAADAAHRNVNPVLYRREEAQACWRQVSAPVLWITQADPAWRRALGISDEDYESRMACFSDFRTIAIEQSGHNLHHDQPERVADGIEGFLSEER